MKKLLALILLNLMLIGCNDKDDPTPLEYIKIVTTSQEYNFTVKPDIDIANMYIISENQDQLSLIMTNNSYSCQIHLDQTDLLSKNFPYLLPNESGSGFGEIQIRNEQVQMDTLFGEKDSINFSGNTYQGLEIEVLNFEQGVLTGKIKGPIQTRTGRGEMIETGEFKLMINIEDDI